MSYKPWFFIIFFLFCLNAIASPKLTPVSSAQAVPAIFSNSEMPPDIVRILERGTLIVGILKKDLPPFFFHGPLGILRGYDIDLATDIAAKLGVKVEFNREAETYDQLTEMLAKRQIDMVSRLSPTLLRAQKASFSDSILDLKQALLVNRLMLAKAGVGEKSEEILHYKNLRIGMLTGSVYEAYFTNGYPNTPITHYKDMDQAMQDVSTGKLIAVFYAKELIEYWLRKNPNANLYAELVIIPNRFIPETIAVRWSDIYLTNWLDTYLETIKNNSFAERLYNRYLGDKG